MAETEAILLKRFAKSRDAEAFAEISRRHAGLVYGAALRILADVDRASDVAQETFLQLTKDAATVTGSLPAWLHRVATHKAIDQVRREATRRRREAQYVAGRPDQTAEWKEISPYVDEGLDELDPGIREILVAHFLAGHTTRQIAGVQGISQATVSRRIEAGVEQLRAKLRRRGIIVAVGVLSSLLGENAVEAAPALLLSELGKMALAGGSAAVATAAATGTGSGLGAAATGVVAAVKTHAAAVAAVAIIGAGSVITYQHAVKSTSMRSASSVPAAPVLPSPPPRVSSPTVVSQRRPAPDTGRSPAAEEWDAMMNAVASQAGRRSGETPAAQPSEVQPQVASTVARLEDAPLAGGSGDVMGGFAMAGSPEPPEEPAREGPVARYFAAGAADGTWSPTPPPDPNDPNASDGP
jgi:RNA polymerase sigma factor (sigma-70 family)